VPQSPQKPRLTMLELANNFRSPRVQVTCSGFIET